MVNGCGVSPYWTWKLEDLEVTVLAATANKKEKKTRADILTEGKVQQITRLVVVVEGAICRGKWMMHCHLRVRAPIYTTVNPNRRSFVIEVVPISALHVYRSISGATLRLWSTCLQIEVLEGDLCRLWSDFCVVGRHCCRPQELSKTSKETLTSSKELSTHAERKISTSESAPMSNIKPIW